MTIRGLDAQEKIYLRVNKLDTPLLKTTYLALHNAISNPGCEVIVTCRSVGEAMDMITHIMTVGDKLEHVDIPRSEASKEPVVEFTNGSCVVFKVERK